MASSPLIRMMVVFFILACSIMKFGVRMSWMVALQSLHFAMGPFNAVFVGFDLG